jgi:hypothetical protein
VANAQAAEEEGEGTPELRAVVGLDAVEGGREGT